MRPEPNHPWSFYANNHDVPPVTITRTANEAGLHNRRRRKKPFLNPSHIYQRLDWAWSEFWPDWKSVVFTDECSVESGVRKGISWTIRRPGEELEDKHLLPTFKQSCKTVMVWAAIAWNNKWPVKRLVHDPRYDQDGSKNGVNRFDYINSVLEERLAGYVSEMRRESNLDVTVVEDGAKIHDNKLASQAREELHITPQFHPPNSPDFNPIEPLWGILKQRIGKIRLVPSTESALYEALEREWDGIEQELVNEQVERMPERRRRLLEAKGHHIPF